MPRKINIDKIDLKIIEILSEDASLSNKKLSQLVGLSEAPTLRRVNALYKKGILVKTTAEVNQVKLGYKVVVVLMAKVHHTKSPSFRSKLSQLEPLDVYFLEGKGNIESFFIKLRFKTRKELKQFEESIYENFPDLLDYSIEVIKEKI